MKKLFLISVFVSLFFFLYTQTLAEVPQMINYQGKLTTNTGAPVNDTLQMIFSIYSDEGGTNLLWTEAQDSVVVEKGVFNVLLGSVDSIPYSVFDGSIRYLGVQVGDDPEITPRKPMVSVAYAYKSFEADTADYARGFSGTVENADKVDGFHASSAPTPGYLYPLDGSAKIPNARLYTGSGNGLDADLLDGQHAGAFALSGHNHDAVYINDGAGEINATNDFNFPSPTFIINLDADKLDGQDASAFLSTANDYGRSGVATDLYEGTRTLSSRYVNTDSSDSVCSTSGMNAFLGKLTFTLPNGENVRSGVRGVCIGSGAVSAEAIGVFGMGNHTGSGEGIGGRFQGGPDGTGIRVGVAGYTDGGSPDVGTGNTGVYGYGKNISSGRACGGSFETFSGGTGNHYGVYCAAENQSSADAYGGFFTVPSTGTGYHRAVYAIASSNSLNFPIGVYGYAENASLGSAFGGMFSTSSAGTGLHYGLQVGGYGASSSLTCGVDASAQNTSSGNVYAGSFYASSSGTGIHYGVYSYEAAGGSGAAVYSAGDYGGSGGKYAVVKTSKGHRLLSVIESPEIWFEDFGEGQLLNGKAHIELDPLFLETITINAEHPMKVFVQLTSGDPMILVVNKGTTGFDVIASDKTSNATFDYRVIAKRKGYETERLRETDMGKDDPNLYPEIRAEIEKRHQEEQLRMEEEMKRTNRK